VYDFLYKILTLIFFYLAQLQNSYPQCRYLVDLLFKKKWQNIWRMEFGY